MILGLGEWPGKGEEVTRYIYGGAEPGNSKGLLDFPTLDACQAHVSLVSSMVVIVLLGSR